MQDCKREIEPKVYVLAGQYGDWRTPAVTILAKLCEESQTGPVPAIHLGAGDKDTDPVQWLQNVNCSSASCLVFKRISPRDEDEMDSKPCEGLRLLCQL